MSDQRHYALLGHLDSFERYRWFFRKLREQDKEDIPDQKLEVYLRGMPASRAAEIMPMRGKAGVSIRGCYIDCYFNPEALGDVGARNRAMVKVQKGCQAAANLGVKVAALGGFTSILGEFSKDPLTVIKNTAFTTGNTLTAWATIQGVLQMAKVRHIELSDARVMIIGASGDIGSGITRWFQGRVKHLDLFARNFTRLRHFAEGLPMRSTVVEYHPEDLLVETARKVDICISVASTVAGAFSADLFPDHAVISDVGYPKNIKPRADGGGPVVLYGGMVQVPEVTKAEPEYLHSELYPLGNIFHGCLAEALVLAMAGRYEPYSHGRGNITASRIDEIGELARNHGFAVSNPYGPKGWILPQAQAEPAEDAASQVVAAPY